MARKWKGVLAIEGEQTGDGRIIAEGAITWAPLPLPLKAEHYAEDVIGNIETIERIDNKIVATGVLDDDTEIGAERARMMDAGTAPLGNRWGLSIEPDDVSAELIDTQPEEVEAPQPAVDIVAEIANAEVLDCTGEGECVVIASASVAGWKVGSLLDRIRHALLAAAGKPIPDDAVVVDEFVSGKFVERVTAMRIRAVATVATEALVGCYLELTADEPAADDVVEEPADTVDEPIVASAPIKPPRAWFEYPEPEAGDERLVPQFDIDTGEYIGDAVPLHITDEGQVFGHLAPKERCHIGYAGVCVTPPESASAYSHFHIGYTVTDEGDVTTGPLVANCDHASTMGLDTRAARDWYAHNGLAWANVRITPGQFGPWVCGAIRPTISDELVVALRGGGISGDWRGEGNGLELIAVLAVNTPGFTVQRGLAASAGAVIIAGARSFLEVVGDRIRLVNRPVSRYATAEPEHTCTKCGGASTVDEPTRLLRAIYAATAGPAAKAKLAARLGR